MKLLTPAIRAASAAATYARRHTLGHRRQRETHAALVALGDAPTPEQVREVVNGDFLTACWCDECQTHVAAVAVFERIGTEGGLPNAQVCGDCLSRAIAVLGGQE